MADLERLVATDQLKTTRLKASAGGAIVHLHYNPAADELVIHFIPARGDVIVHPLDGDVALLYEGDTHEIVGLQVDNFKFRFLPDHAEVARVWRSSQDMAGKDLGELELVLQVQRARVTREVVEASRDLLPTPQVEDLEAVVRA